MITEKNLLPEVGFIRAKELLKIIPIGRSTLYLWIKEGKIPKPTKIGTRTSVWKVEDIRALIAKY